MKVTQLYVYPIKSLRGVSMQSATISRTGFAHDRQFMLLKVEKDDSGTCKLGNMHVPHFPAMCLFTTAFRTSGSSPRPDQVVVTYSPSEDPNLPGPKDTRTLDIPLFPDTNNLDVLEVMMHSSPTTAWRMPKSLSSWFSECFGFEVVLAYIGSNTRAVLGSLSPKPNTAKQGWGYLSSLKSTIGLGEAKPKQAGLTFADCANFLVVTEESLANCSDRLSGGERMDVTKFRPNIVVSGADKAWDEDYWAALSFSELAQDNADQENEEADLVEIVLTANCARCASINVDYRTGQMAKGESGQMLKMLQKDRRIDLGAKYSPVFGRYGYLGKGLGGEIKLGCVVAVESKNQGHTKFDWPGVAGVPAAPKTT